MATSKVVKLSHVTLDPNLLHGVRDAVATEGKVHAAAMPFMRIDGADYTAASENISPDVLISRPEIARKAAALWDAVGQALADDAGCPVEYSVGGEIRSFQPVSVKR